jgi:hypothetical protein
MCRFDGILVHDGVLGGSNGALYRKWDINSICFSSQVAGSMTITRFYELKSSKKLCHNGSSPQRGMDGYDPAYKFDLIYKTLVHNVNAVSKFADENQVLDESTWGHSGYGEAGSGLTGRLMNKPVSKGGQVVIISDVGRFRPRAYMHRHNLHERAFSREGPSELHALASSLLPMVDGHCDATTRKLFKAKFCVTVDNYFISDDVLNWAGRNGLGVIGTNRRDELPKDIKSDYLHKIPTPSQIKHAKVARFTKPIVAVKDYEEGYQRVHVSFQSTSSCNIASHRIAQIYTC